MQEFAENFLTFLERREEKLLSWGFYNVQYTEADIRHALNNEAPQELLDQWNKLKAQGNTFRSIIRQLRRSHLIHRLPEAPKMYRTRMAEGIRLLANLKQIFNHQDWAIGPRLVSDIKIHLKDRFYPRRNLPAIDVFNDKLGSLCSSSKKPLLRDCFDALSQDASGKSYKFSGFQKRSFEHIFQEYNSKNWSGSVICAGTGSGKTKAFYLPAFLKVAEEISVDQNHYTKVIAIYPRNVLLADQLREALSESNKMLPVLKRYGYRPITFGALLGRTPGNNWFKTGPQGQRRPSWYWEQAADGHVIPYLTSPIDGHSNLIWKQVDIEKGRTCLYRLGKSVPDIPDKTLLITREQLMRHPPDILFLSLEMLNREMGNPQWRKAFGIKQGDRAPRLILLDEVHTYEGIAGAQAAWVLRRWKYWMHTGKKANPSHFVGLSATLKDAPDHMGRMCGIPPNRVLEFSPSKGFGPDGEIEIEGQEYNLAIKGDPSSGTALLSTSIQTAMLLTRLLTPRNYVSPLPAQPIKAHTFHLKKAFGFTDNLDSLNRWFANMRDAERQGLAGFRSVPNPLPDPLILRRMREEGQIWELPHNIGHDLFQSLDVSRCSSQDPGANSNSDLILATSSLEVGFDDPQVGMILHHKAPTSMSSFIQRKGRAGRSRGSRPWTAVILSDYGRDRWAFQAAERLFNPEIDRIHLPIANPYVLRIQLALFLVDYLGQVIDKPWSPFSYLSKPSTGGTPTQGQADAKKYLEDFMKQGALWQRFYQSIFWFYFYGRGGLSKKREEDKAIARDELSDILWEEPRPLLTSAIPALLRKLEVQWRQLGANNSHIEDAGSGRPMPQSIPKATFEEIDLNEARIELEPYRGRDKEDELLSMPQFLRESCPGRVSKRYSTFANLNPPEPGYWHVHSPNLQVGQNTVSLAQLYPEHVSLTSVRNTHVCCPTNANLVHIPNDTIESSSSEWQWETIAKVHNDSNKEYLPTMGSKPWNQIFTAANAHLHINGSWIEVLRYATNCRFEIRRRNRNSTQGILTLHADDGSSEAVGFQVKADGVRFEIENNHLKRLPLIPIKMLAQFRYEYFLHQIKSSPALQNYLNVFRAEWMAHISIAMLSATAIKENVSLAGAQKLVSGIRPESARRVLEIIFQIRGVTPLGRAEESRLQQDILDLWRNQNVVTEIEQLEAVLWNNPPGSNYNQWLQQRYLATLAQALRVAAATVSDQVDEEDLIVDVINVKGKTEIFLTEKNSGGLGQMESIVGNIKGDPKFFLEAIEHALTNCPRNLWATNLNAVSKCVHNENKKGSGGLADAFKDVRNSKSLVALEQAKSSLVAAMQDYGLNPQRSNIAAVAMKLLRPGSTQNTDMLTYLLNEAWQRQSLKIGLSIPIRTFAYIISSYEPSQRRLIKLFRQIHNETPSFSQLYAIVQQLLFESCDDCCPDCLDNPNYFNDFGKPARNLALSWLSLNIAEVVVNASNHKWTNQARKILENEGRVCLISDVSEQNFLINNVVPLFFEELNVQNYKESIHISKVECVAGHIRLTLNIRDFTNV